MKRFRVLQKLITERWCYLDAEDEDEAIEIASEFDDGKWQSFGSNDYDDVEMIAEEVESDEDCL